MERAAERHRARHRLMGIVGLIVVVVIALVILKAAHVI